MKLIDTTIYIDGLANPSQREALLRRLRGMPGIIAPRFTPGREHMLLVAYNPEQTTPDQLLGQVKAEGLKARIVAF